jgi:hypothetical protein
MTSKGSLIHGYSIKQSINRLLQVLSGNRPTTDDPGTLSGDVYSENVAWSRLAELVSDSLPGYGLTIPFGNHPALPTGTPITLGGWLYAQNGALYWYGASGTITTLAGS